MKYQSHLGYFKDTSTQYILSQTHDFSLCSWSSALDYLVLQDTVYAVASTMLSNRSNFNISLHKLVTDVGISILALRSEYSSWPTLPLAFGPQPCGPASVHISFPLQCPPPFISAITHTMPLLPCKPLHMMLSLPRMCFSSLLALLIST